MASDSTSAPSQNINNKKNGEANTSGQNSRPPGTERQNDPTFRDDSTDASMGMSGLDATPGTATTTGAGGLGTNQNPGYNTSSDIYNIERRDSIEKARKKDEDARQKTNTRGD